MVNKSLKTELRSNIKERYKTFYDRYQGLLSSVEFFAIIIGVTVRLILTYDDKLHKEFLVSGEEAAKAVEEQLEQIKKLAKLDPKPNQKHKITKPKAKKGNRKALDKTYLANSTRRRKSQNARQKTLFKKTEELAVLCGIQASIVISRNGKEIVSGNFGEMRHDKEELKILTRLIKRQEEKSCTNKDPPVVMPNDEQPAEVNDASNDEPNDIPQENEDDTDNSYEDFSSDLYGHYASWEVLNTTPNDFETRSTNKAEETGNISMKASENTQVNQKQNLYLNSNSQTETAASNNIDLISDDLINFKEKQELPSCYMRFSPPPDMITF
ncbi:hypothetical protein DFJ63DRAFT_337537 [Scheffersomyces coipomensis]|uniref:uncharacterized protein n=1 Tax=Scheffersomyces coipomensis TaxID=1788519 RepID=UPI00315D8B1C